MPVHSKAMCTSHMQLPSCLSKVVQVRRHLSHLAGTITSVTHPPLWGTLSQMHGLKSSTDDHFCHFGFAAAQLYNVQSQLLARQLSHGRFARQAFQHPVLHGNTRRHRISCCGTCFALKLCAPLKAGVPGCAHLMLCYRIGSCVRDAIVR